MIKWAVNGIFKADPVQVFREINSIGDSYTPEDVVNLARNTSTELHGLFEWNDSIAAEKYRIYQAKAIIRSLVYVEESKDDEEQRTVTYVRAIVKDEEKCHYAQIPVVAKNHDAYLDLLEEAKRDARAFMKKYKTLKEFEVIFEEMESLLAE